MLNNLIQETMKRVFVSIKGIVIVVAMIFSIMCAFPGCRSSKKAPESTLDADKQKFRQDVFDKEFKN